MFFLSNISEMLELNAKVNTEYIVSSRCRLTVCLFLVKVLIVV